MKEEYFQGFTREMVDFLWELRFNNNKEWFDKNRDRYKVLLKEPMDLFAKEMTVRLNSLDEDFDTIPSVSRINRDIRFSKNKAPYKEGKWIVFKNDAGRWQDKPVFFFEVKPEGYTYGMGFYDCMPYMMQNLRKKIDANEEEVRRLNKALEKQDEFFMEGDFYKKRYGNKPEDIMNWYQRKAIAFISKPQLDDTMFCRTLLDKVEEGFRFLVPFHKYLMTIANRG